MIYRGASTAADPNHGNQGTQLEEFERMNNALCSIFLVHFFHHVS